MMTYKATLKHLKTKKHLTRQDKKTYQEIRKMIKNKKKKPSYKTTIVIESNDEYNYCYHPDTYKDTTSQYHNVSGVKLANSAFDYKDFIEQQYMFKCPIYSLFTTPPILSFKDMSFNFTTTSNNSKVTYKTRTSDRYFRKIYKYLAPPKNYKSSPIRRLSNKDDAFYTACKMNFCNLDNYDVFCRRFDYTCSTITIYILINPINKVSNVVKITKYRDNQVVTSNF